MKILLPLEHARLLVTHEMSQFEAAQAEGDIDTAWHSLERIHIISQGFGIMHLSSHWRMLLYVWALRDTKEVFGQLTRLALAPVGNLTGKLPFGNTGRANVSAFLPMELPADLSAQITKFELPQKRQ